MHNRLVVRPLTILASVAMLAGAMPALARPGGWGSPGWGSPGWGYPGRGPTAAAPRPERDRSREGRITVDRFVGEGDAASVLGHGAIAVASQSGNDDYVGLGDRAAYEAAVVDRLVHAGYDTARAQPDGGQVAELRVLRTELEPAERKRSPVSGEASMGVSNHGSAYGLALDVDLTKPLPPLVSTRLETRIRDRVTGKVLWEGHAEVATREGDARWSDQTIAARLAEALFDGFPHASDTLGGKS
jgi:hypothetical protein